MIARAVLIVAISTALIGLQRTTRDAPSIVAVGPNVQVSASMPQTMHGEGTIVADPSDPRRLMVCSMIRDATIGEAVVVYLSSDGGARWQRTFESGAEEHAGDPSCGYDADGAAYLSYIPLRPQTALSVRLPLFRSSDGRRTWQRGPSTEYLDRDSLVLDTTGGRFRHRVYLHGTSAVYSTTGLRRDALALYTSVDAGRSLQQRVERASLDRRHVAAAGNGVVLSDGRWLTAFAELKEFYDSADGNAIRRSGFFAEPPESENAWLRVITSDDGGESLDEPVTISGWHFPNVYSRYSIYAPAVAADGGTSVFRNRVYAVWPDARFGGTDILLSYSTDRGRTWSPPIVVNDDPRPTSPSPNHLLPAAAVNNAGVVAVTWLDRRDAGDRLAWHARIRVSMDGGETFLPSVVMSEAPARFDGRERWPVTASTTGGGSARFAGGLLRMQVFAPIHVYCPGDYAGLTASTDGVFHPYWIDNRTGWHQVWTAAVRVSDK